MEKIKEKKQLKPLNPMMVLVVIMLVVADYLLLLQGSILLLPLKNYKLFPCFILLKSKDPTWSASQ